MKMLPSNYPKQPFEILLVLIMLALCSLALHPVEVLPVPQAQIQGAPKVLWVSEVPDGGTVWFISYAIIQDEVVAYVLSSGGITFLRLDNGGIIQHVNTNATPFFALPLVNSDFSPYWYIDVIAGINDYLLRISSVNGSIVWGRKLSSSITTGDLIDVNGDKYCDVLVGDSSGNVYLVSGRDGGLIWSKEVDTAPIIGITGMYVYSGSESTKWTVAALNPNGTLRWAEKMNVGMKNPPLYESYIDSGIDINGDGYGDVIIATESSVIMLSGYDGLVLWTRPISVRVVRVLVTYDDFDGDGVYDVVLGTRNGIYLLSGLSGNVIWSNPVGYVFSIDNFYEEDLNNDGYSEIIVATDAKTYTLSGKNGEVLWSYEPESLTTSVEWSWVHSSEQDIDGDGYRDILVGTNNGYVIAISAASATPVTSPTTVAYTDTVTVTHTATRTVTVTSPTTVAYTDTVTVTHTATRTVTVTSNELPSIGTILLSGFVLLIGIVTATILSRR